MSLSFLFVVVSFNMLTLHPSWTQGGGRELYFPYYYFFAKRRLMNHTIKTLHVKSLDDCEYLCYMEDACVSLNIKNPVTGMHECELNNSTHMEHGGALIPDKSYWYRGAMNNCEKSGRPCMNNATCESGFTDKGYRCVCTPGFTGEHCDNDINECSASVPVCDVNANCQNTPGSHVCSCKAGFNGDGKTCSDVDECVSGLHDCHNSASCTNTVGSYTCSCNQHFTGDGKTCTLAPECQSYRSLTSADRKINFGPGNSCDDKLGPGWFRFQGAAGSGMPTSCPPEYSCGTDAPGWLNGGHPTVADGKVTRQVCFHLNSHCCYQFKNIQVRSCGSFYVYYFNGAPGCFFRYCGTE